MILDLGDSITLQGFEHVPLLQQDIPAKGIAVSYNKHSFAQTFTGITMQKCRRRAYFQ